MSGNLAERPTEYVGLQSAPDGLPVFKGATVEEHLEAWEQVKQGIESRLWSFAAIAASLVTSYGDKTIDNFAHEVRLSGRYIRELAQTYRAFENGARAPILSFKHHSIASRHADPIKVIHKAEDDEWSTRDVERYVDTGLEPGEASGINASVVAKATESDKPIEAERDLQAIGDRELIGHIQEALQTVQALKLKCPRAKFVSDVYVGWEEELNDHLENLTLGVLRDKVVRAWKDGYREERQIASMTGIPGEEIHGVMKAYEREGIFEKVNRRKTKMAKGSPPWIWHLVGESLGSDYVSVS